MLPALSLIKAGCRTVRAGCMDSASGVVAFVEREGRKVFSCGCDTLAEPDCYIPERDAQYDALALSSDGKTLLLAAADGSLLRCDLSGPADSCTDIQLPAESPDVATPVTCIARSDADGLYGVAVGSYVYIIDAEGCVTGTHGPLPSPVLQLRWAGGGGENRSSLVALTEAACHVWLEGQGTPTLLPCPEGRLVSLAVPPLAHSVAAACDNCKVLCWNVAGALSAAADGLPLPDPITLSAYEAPVRCMAWDADGKFLATSDGSDCTVWDMSSSDAAASGSHLSEADSVMCCGHDPASHITCMLFQPQGPLLATMSNVGKLAVFDSRAFRRGGVAGPYATAQVAEDCGCASESAGEGGVMAWLPGDKLVVAAPEAGLAWYSVSRGEGDGMPPSSPALNALKIGPSHSSTVAELACVDYLSSPLTPHHQSSAETGDLRADFEAEENGEVMGEKEGVMPPPPPPAAGVTRPSPIRIAAGPEAPPPRAPVIVAESSSGGRLEQSSSSSRRNGRNRRTNSSSSGGGTGGAGGGGGGPPTAGASTAAAAAAAAGSPRRPPAAMSPSLLEHIQHLHDTPPSGRGDQQAQQQLTGWGMGVAGGGGGGGPAVQYYAQAGGHAMSPSGYTAVPVQYAHYAQVGGHMSPGHAVPMAMAQMGGGYHAGTASHPRYAGAAAMQAMQAQQQAAGMPGWGMQGMQQGGAMAGYMQQQQQQQQQWAGVAPGYMAYQHGAAYAVMGPSRAAYPQSSMAAAAQQQQARVNGGGSPKGREQQAGGGGGESSGEKEASVESGSDVRPSPQRRQKSRRNSSNSNGSGAEQTLSSASSSAPRRVGAAPETTVGAPMSPNSPSSSVSAVPPSSPGGSLAGAAAAGGPPSPSSTVYIGNLPSSVDDHVLAWTCAHYGPVSHAQVIRDKASQASKGFGFVTFSHPAYAAAAMQQMNGQVMYGPFGGQRIKVGPTNKRPPGAGPF